MPRIDLYDAKTKVRVGYLRQVGKEVSLVATRQGFEIDHNRPPLDVKDQTEATTCFTKFTEQRHLGGKLPREFTFKLA